MNESVQNLFVDINKIIIRKKKEGKNMRYYDSELEYFRQQKEKLEKEKESERKERGILKLEEIEKALYIIDMNNGFVNFGPMANPAYNALVPEQLKTVEKIRKEKGQVNFILEGHKENALEFKTYPKHCVLGTPEADLIPEFINEQYKVNTNIYYKNCINGMMNNQIKKDIRKLKALKEVIFEGVCADLCVMDFARTYARFLDEINKDVKLFVVKSTIDTFDAPNHNRDEWNEISYKVMEQAGIEVVENVNELESREKELGLYLRKERI